MSVTVGVRSLGGLFLSLTLITRGGIQQQVSDLLKDKVSLKYSSRPPLLRDGRESHLWMCHSTVNKYVQKSKITDPQG